MGELLVFLLNPLLLYPAPTVRNPTPTFPVQFVQSGSEWIARGPGYQVTVAGAGAILELFHPNGRKESLRMDIVGARTSAKTAAREEAGGLHPSPPRRLGRNRNRWRDHHDAHGSDRH